MPSVHPCRIPRPLQQLKMARCTLTGFRLPPAISLAHFTTSRGYPQGCVGAEAQKELDLRGHPFAFNRSTSRRPACAATSHVWAGSSTPIRSDPLQHLHVPSLSSIEGDMLIQGHPCSRPLQQLHVHRALVLRGFPSTPGALSPLQRWSILGNRR